MMAVVDVQDISFHAPLGVYGRVVAYVHSCTETCFTEHSCVLRVAHVVHTCTSYQQDA